MGQIKKNKSIFVMLLIFTILIIISLIVLSFSYHFLGFIVAFLAIGSSIGLSVFYYNKVFIPFKQNIIQNILKTYNPNLEYIYDLKEKSHYINIIKNYKIIPSATSFKFTDGIKESILGNTVSSYDLYATHTQHSGKTSTTIVDFKGRFYDIEFDGLSCDFILKEESLKKIPDGYELLDLEHIDFNEKFNLYTSDKLEIFKIFTPSKIKKYFELAGLDEDKTFIQYLNKHLYVYIYNSSNLFEDHKNPEISVIEEYKKQYENIVNYLNVFSDYK